MVNSLSKKAKKVIEERLKEIPPPRVTQADEVVEVIQLLYEWYINEKGKESFQV